MNQPIKLFAIFGILIGSLLSADELKFKNGHLATRDLVSIRLTKNQVDLLKKEFRPNFPIQLTEDQRSVLWSVLKKTQPPTEIGVFRQTDLDGGCSCGLVNFGILYRNNILEIPIWALCSDEEAEKIYRSPEPAVIMVK